MDDVPEARGRVVGHPRRRSVRQVVGVVVLKGHRDIHSCHHPLTEVGAGVEARHRIGHSKGGSCLGDEGGDVRVVSDVVAVRGALIQEDSIHFVQLEPFLHFRLDSGDGDGGVSSGYVPENDRIVEGLKGLDTLQVVAVDWETTGATVDVGNRNETISCH